ncbi:MAG: T9SS type A sorting domain-containing protein [Bacteroidales bacterium]|nr:T9SS type A sorting domain-containing protein [Bacteroidales bacterium]
MKTKFTILTTLLMAMLAMGFSLASAQAPAKEDNPNFRYIDDFEPPIEVSLWWAADYSGSGSTTGIIEDVDDEAVTYREFETEIVNPATGSTGSMKLAYMWDEDKPLAPGSHLIRLHMPEGNSNQPERQFLPHQAIEVFMYGDGSGNRFRFMTREKPNNQLEGSQWFTIDWVGWKRITWRLSEDPVLGWVNGNGLWDGNYIIFDSFQLTWSGQAAGVTGAVYFDDLRIVDAFDVDFTVEAAGGGEIADAIVSLNGIDYAAGVYNFELFPGEYQYFVKKDGYLTAAGTFEVDDAGLTVPVEMTAGTDPEYTVTFSVFDLEGELITDAVISIDGVPMPAGTYTFEATPGFYPYEVTRPGFYPTDGMVAVVNANVFVNVELIQDPAIFNNIILSWDVAATAAEAPLRAEHYSVWIAEVPEGDYAFDEEDFVMVFEETLSTEIPAWDYQNRSVEISWYHSTDVRVAFRHHDVTAMERLVIDNVEITALRTGDSPAIVLFEDFEEGLAEPIDPEWLPEGWMAIDNDEDGRNWFFGVLEGDGYMASRSRLANGNPLTPDNWLVSAEIALPVVSFFNIAFVVKDQDENDVDGATITINGQTLEAGVYTYSAPNGTYDYSIAKEGYQGTSGQVTVAGANQTVNVTIIQERYDVTFELDARYAPGFEPGSGNYYITGSFPGINWATPGSMPDEQLLDATDNVYIFTITMELPAGSYQYKYFDGPSWDDGEWPGDPNRVIEVTGPMEVYNWFGSLTDPTSVPVIAEGSLNLYPNPARDILNIVADEPISQIQMIDMLGQLVYLENGQGNRHQINVANLKQGIYFVRVKTISGIINKRVQVLK